MFNDDLFSRHGLSTLYGWLPEHEFCGQYTASLRNRPSSAVIRNEATTERALATAPEEKLNTYNQRNIDTMELVYGDGFMSPGGAAEVRQIATGLHLEDCRLLDLGCGLGGACIALAEIDATLKITGVDIETSVLQRACELVEAAGLQNRIDLVTVEPGPLPFAPATFHYVYANSVTCHFAELNDLFADIQRVLKPGGSFIGSEWFIDRNTVAFERWDELLRQRGLNFFFVTREHFEIALLATGYEDIKFRDRHEAISAVATQASSRVEQELKPRLMQSLGEDGYAALADWSRSRAAVLDDAGMSHGHFFATKVA
jgi:ubiquinone/menaquinone biosynthesis C-methylase UbiE